MRLDKFLKVSRIIKRRTVACQACDGNRVSVNGKTAKPAHILKAGDLVEVRFGEKTLKFSVKSIDEKLARGDGSLLYDICGEA